MPRQPHHHFDLARKKVISNSRAAHTAPTRGTPLRGILQDVPSAVTVNEATRILLHAADAFGNRLRTSPFAASLTVSATGPSVAVTDVSPGVAALDITATSLGTFTVDVQLRGVSLRGAPVALQAYSTLTADLSKTVAWGSLLGAPRVARD
jgi:hypothetical protein